MGEFERKDLATSVREPSWLAPADMQVAYKRIDLERKKKQRKGRKTMKKE